MINAIEIQDISDLNIKVSEVFSVALNMVKNNKVKFKKVFIFMINLHFSARQKEILEKLDEKIKNIELNKNSLMRLISLYKIESNYEIQDSSLAPYMGVKIQHSDKMIKAFKDTIDDDTDTVCDTFLGMGGSITALNNVMKRFKIKNLILGDFNPTTLNLHKNVAENTEELIDAFIEVYRTINLKDGNIFKPAQETLDSLKNTLTVLEKSGQHSNVYASALFMFIQPLQFGGGYDSRLDENNNLVSKLSSKVIGYPMYFRTIFNSIHNLTFAPKSKHFLSHILQYTDNRG